MRTQTIGQTPPRVGVGQRDHHPIDDGLAAQPLVDLAGDLLRALDQLLQPLALRLRQAGLEQPSGLARGAFNQRAGLPGQAQHGVLGRAAAARGGAPDQPQSPSHGPRAITHRREPSAAARRAWRAKV